MAVVDSSEYTWAVIYIIGCSTDPFAKAPIVPDTVLAAQAVVGLTQEKRMVNYNGTVANGVIAQYKVYMFCGPEFFPHVSEIVDILNWFYGYLRSDVDPFMSRETAYAMCTSVFPAKTDRSRALRALLSPLEVKEMTRSNADMSAMEPIRFGPHPIMEDEIIR